MCAKGLPRSSGRRASKSIEQTSTEEGTRTVRSTRRLPAAAGAAAVVLAAATLGACTAGGSSSGTGSGSDGKPVPLAGSTLSPAPPGKYQTLPQPCLAVNLDVLKRLVPGAPDYTGAESLTYDTDRRVGCSWRGGTDDGTTRSLRIDVERVVSYDPAISDEVQADSDFRRQAAAASIPPAAPTTAATTAGTPAGTGDGNPGGTGGTDEGSGPGSGLAPRRLADVGNAAFINDVPKTGKTGAAGPRRDVTLVFRTANVLVSVLYSETAPADGTQPRSADLQKGAQDVADELERRIER
jgi:hypothetical protein